MITFRQKIEQIMSGTDRTDESRLDRVLHAASKLYGVSVDLRGRLYDRGHLGISRLPCRVISVGNITVGGTGKTPMTISLTRMIQSIGKKVAVLSRGYKGTAEKTGTIVSDGERLLCGPTAAGDEPFMMAASLPGVPVLVGADRYAVGMQAVSDFSPDVIILDDAFQHRRLHRDLDLVMVDDHRFLGNMHLLPRGPLRESITGLNRADAFVLTRCGKKSASLDRLREMAPEKPIFKTFHRPYLHGVFDGKAPQEATIHSVMDAADLHFLKTARVIGFSGIAQNEVFEKMIRSLSGEVTAFVSFSDHHAYTDADIDRIAAMAEEDSADYIVTTTKDFVRVAGRIPGSVRLAVIGVEIGFLENDESFFSALIQEKCMDTGQI